ncbi:hypothetical protein CN689_21600 [Peribacillus butanolivorans]|uniref:Uncharacterized protein n=1 Tax=Peribacillus butanolivorans TaxID=421767 RepID=A0AAX0S1F7_9BACI|nr:hypothetical protein [Peribacillus butanolivorans]PEJ29879.1 hypothetical protein CN689_21600 [Peribacillus butanolivorans]
MFFLSGLIIGSMESILFTDIFGKAGKSIPFLFALPLIYLIRDYYKEIKEVDFGMMLLLSIALQGLVFSFVD